MSRLLVATAVADAMVQTMRENLDADATPQDLVMILATVVALGASTATPETTDVPLVIEAVCDSLRELPPKAIARMRGQR